MKRLFAFLFILLCAIIVARGAGVVLAWDASPSPEVIGYRIYVGVASRNYTNTVTLSNVLTATITNLIPGNTYYFSATAYSTNLESDFSNEVSYTVPTNALPSKVENFRLQMVK